MTDQPPRLAWLKAVAETPPENAPETRPARIARLQAEAKAAGGELVADMLETMRAAAILCEDAAKADGAVAPGIRDLARRNADAIYRMIDGVVALKGRAK